MSDDTQKPAPREWRTIGKIRIRLDRWKMEAFGLKDLYDDLQFVLSAYAKLEERYLQLRDGHEHVIHKMHVELEAAQKEIAELKGGLDAALKVQNDITDAAVAKLTHAQRKLQAERAKVESLLKENDALRSGSPAFQLAAELQAKVSELEADVALLKKEKSSLMRSLAKFTGNA